MFCNVAVPHTRLGELTYAFNPADFAPVPGDCVRVRLRGKKVKALVVEVLEKSPVAKTLPVDALVEPGLVDPGLLRLLRWVDSYYFGRMGETLGAALPRGICGYGLRRKPAPMPETPAATPSVAEAGRVLPAFPREFGVFVSTSRPSREEVVSAFCRQALERGSVVVMTPETDGARWAESLRSLVGCDPVFYHSEMKLSERKRAWRRLRSASRALVVGVRSAVFAPMPDTAGIVVLDEHDKVYKEERHPRFNGRDTAIARARMAGFPVLLCDDTPSTETWLNVTSGSYKAMPGTAPARPDEPAALVVDMRKHRGDLLAPVVASELKEVAARGESAVLYLNRKGLSRYIACSDCGTALSCADCGVAMILVPGGRLVCRYCGRSTGAPDACPACAGPKFEYKAPGVEMVLREVSRLLPSATVRSVIGDDGEPVTCADGDIIVGTRAVLGIDWPARTRLVAAVSVDADLCLPDFRAGERTFQSLYELARRGSELRALVVFQTRRPDDPAVRSAADQDPAAFLDQELAVRKEAGFPPFRRLALIDLDARKPADAERAAERLAARLNSARGVEVLGPLPIPGRARAQRLLVKLDRNLRLDRLVSRKMIEQGGVDARVDVDPIDTA
jgi:primosomal protein N' (replication factor Y)